MNIADVGSEIAYIERKIDSIECLIDEFRYEKILKLERKNCELQKCVLNQEETIKKLISYVNQLNSRVKELENLQK